MAGFVTERVPGSVKCEAFVLRHLLAPIGMVRSSEETACAHSGVARKATSLLATVAVCAAGGNLSEQNMF